MKKTAAVILLFFSLAASALGGAGFRDILSTDAKKLMAEKKNVFLLDVRTVEEYRQGRLESSVLIPIGEIERRVGEVPKNRPILVYCAVGSRSSLVAGFLAGKGYREIYNMADGIVGWYRNGLPIRR